MKCKSCGNLIPDDVKVCPYCNSNVGNEENEQQNVVNQEELEVSDLNGQQESIQSSDANQSENEVNNEQVNMSDSTNEVTIEKGDVIPPTSSSNIDDSVISDGAKIASSAPVIKKKKNGKFIFLLILLAIVIIVISFGYFAYNYEYKSGEKRLDAIVNGVFTKLNKNSNKKAGSGSYSVDLKVTSNELNGNVNFDGNYAVDLDKDIIKLGLNVNKLNIEEELLSEPLKVELYSNESKLYVLLNNFYDKYIYTDFPYITEANKQMKETDVNYSVIINSLQNATKAALKRSGYSQDVNDVTINGKTSKVNIISITVNNANAKAMARAFLTNLANNSSFLKEIVKVDNTLTEEEVKEQLLQSIEEFEPNIDEVVKVDIYTSLIGNEFLGIKAYNIEGSSKTLIELSNNEGKMVLTVKTDNKETMRLEMTENIKNTSATVETSYTFKLTTSIEEVNVSIDASIKVVEDKVPNVEKVNVKNSIDYQYLTDTDKQQILENVMSFGAIGEYFQSLLSLGGNDEIQTNPPIDPSEITPSDIIEPSED